MNARRSLIAAAPTGSTTQDIYSLEPDCRAPQLLFTGVVSPAPGTTANVTVGHEMWWSPDGNTLWISRLGAVSPVDVTDPRNPRALMASAFGNSHGGSSSIDGTR